MEAQRFHMARALWQGNGTATGPTFGCSCSCSTDTWRSFAASSPACRSLFLFPRRRRHRSNSRGSRAGLNTTAVLSETPSGTLSLIASASAAPAPIASPLSRRFHRKLSHRFHVSPNEKWKFDWWSRSHWRRQSCLLFCLHYVLNKPRPPLHLVIQTL